MSGPRRPSGASGGDTLFVSPQRVKTAGKRAAEAKMSGPRRPSGASGGDTLFVSPQRVKTAGKRAAEAKMSTELVVVSQRVLLPDGTIAPASVHIAGGLIAAVAAADARPAGVPV